MSKTKNVKIFTMILLITALLITASSSSISNVKAATTTTVLAYTTLGGSVSANGTALTGGASATYTNGDTLQLKATASTGWQFLCFVYADASGSITSTNNPFTKTLNGACALEAVFLPTTNTTATASGTAASLTIFTTIGGTTNPAGSIAGATTTGFTVGHTATVTQSSGTSGDFKFLCWIAQCSSNNYYTSSTLNFIPTASGTALEAIWIPTSSSVTLPSTSATPTPKVPEYSAAIGALIVLALVAAAVGTVAYTKKARK